MASAKLPVHTREQRRVARAALRILGLDRELIATIMEAAKRENCPALIVGLRHDKLACRVTVTAGDHRWRLNFSWLH